MLETLKADLKKYETEIESLNTELQKLENDYQAKKNNLVTVGRRIEGIVAYLRQIVSASDKQSDDSSAIQAETTEVGAA